jgi:hypothetical protein
MKKLLATLSLSAAALTTGAFLSVQVIDDAYARSVGGKSYSGGKSFSGGKGFSGGKSLSGGKSFSGGKSVSGGKSFGGAKSFGGRKTSLGGNSFKGSKSAGLQKGSYKPGKSMFGKPNKSASGLKTNNTFGGKSAMSKPNGFGNKPGNMKGSSNSKPLAGGPNKPGMGAGPNGNKSLAGGPNKPGMGAGPKGSKSLAGGPNKPGNFGAASATGAGPKGNKGLLASGPNKPGNAGAGSAKGTGPKGTQSLAYGPSAANQGAGGAKGAGPSGNKGLGTGPNKPIGQAAASGGAKPNSGTQSLAYKPGAAQTKPPQTHANQMGPTNNNTPTQQQQSQQPQQPYSPKHELAANWWGNFKSNLDPRNIYTVDPFKSPGTAFSYCKLVLQFGCRMPPGFADIILAPAPGKDSTAFETHTPATFFKPLRPNDPLSTPVDATVKGWNPFNQVQNRPPAWGP